MVRGVDVASIKRGLIKIAREAGACIMEVYAAKDKGIDIKNDGSPVTEADRRAEACIVPALKDLFPETMVVSEENPASHSFDPSERFWLVDPLDGTKEFVKRNGQGAFTVNIALIEKREPVLGVVFAPALKRMFYGDIRAGASEIGETGERSISVASATGAERIAVTSSSHQDQVTSTWLRSNKISQTISIGSSFKFCLLAAGEAHVYPRFGPTMEWDTAAGDAILRAAGGMTTTPEHTSFLYGKAGYRNGAFIAWGGVPN